MCASSLYDKIGKCQQIILGIIKENGIKSNKIGRIAMRHFENKFALHVHYRETLVIMRKKSSEF
jgi:hypothetical protein